MKTTFLRNSIIISGVLAIISMQVHAQLIDKIVAQVDDKIILLSDIEAQYMQLKNQGKTEPAPDTRCRILDNLLTQKLLVAQAALDSITLKDEEVESELDNRIRYFSNLAGGQENLEKFYGKPISKIKDEFRDEIRHQLLAQREQQSIIKDVHVTPAEVSAFFSSIPADSLPYYNAQVEVGTLIVYPKVSAELKDLARQNLAQLKDRITKGEDFAKLAGVYSADPGSRDNGGDIGFVSRTDLDPGFAAAAFRLKNVGEVSDIVESKFGLHIIQLEERRGELIRVRHILIRPQTTSYDLKKAYLRIDSIKNVIKKDTLAFSKAVYKFTEDDNTKGYGGLLINNKTGNNTFETGDLDKDIYFIIDTMKPGQISSPQLFKNERGDAGYRLIFLKSETKPHKMNMADDYDKIQSLATGKKRNERFEKWLDTHRAVTYIKIEDNYKNCVVLKKWISDKTNPK